MSEQGWTNWPPEEPGVYAVAASWGVLPGPDEGLGFVRVPITGAKPTWVMPPPAYNYVPYSVATMEPRDGDRWIVHPVDLPSDEEG